MPEPARSTRVMRFGLFEADFAAGELRKSGLKIKLQDRPFEILSILLERPGELVTREEFRQRLWPADTFVDFDHSLNASVNKLRQALDDLADNPRFVATVGRRGYRFIAPLGMPGRQAESVGAGAQEVEPASSIAATAPAPEVAESSILRPRRPIPRKLLAIGFAGIVVTVAVTIFLLRANRKPALTETDSILISDFVNTTGEPIFDDTLKQALAVKLAESPFFNLVPDSTIKTTLGLMGRQANERVVDPIDREVCQRAGAKALVRGSIFSPGNKYSIALRAVDCLKGESLADEKIEATTRDQVLHNLGQVLPSLRRKLGESVGLLQKFDTPIEQATTTSLAALKAYTEGDKKRLQGAETEAIVSYKMAIELDPQFAIAYARLGATYRNTQEEVLADEYLRKGFERREHVSEKEKLYITAHYYSDVTHEYDKDIQTYELWRQIYPRDWIAANNLANDSLRVGQFDKAIEASQTALKLIPNSIYPYTNLARAYKRSGRFAEAKAVCEKTIADKRDTWAIHDLLYEIAFAQRDQAALEREVDWVKANPNATILDDEAWGAASLGQMRKSRSLFEQSRQIALKENFKEFASKIALDEAQLQAELGNASAAREAIALAYRLAVISPVDRGNVAQILARIGEVDQAQKIADELERHFPTDLLLNKALLPAIRAAIALRRNDSAAAIAALQPAIPYDLADGISLMTVYYRGLAYLQKGSASEAAIQFQNALDHQGVVTVAVYLPLARLGLARAYARAGDIDNSRRAYEQLFEHWKNADRDFVLLQKAKAEYARLNHT